MCKPGTLTLSGANHDVVDDQTEMSPDSKPSAKKTGMTTTADSSHPAGPVARTQNQVSRWGLTAMELVVSPVDHS